MTGRLPRRAVLGGIVGGLAPATAPGLSAAAAVGGREPYVPEAVPPGRTGSMC